MKIKTLLVVVAAVAALIAGLWVQQISQTPVVAEDNPPAQLDFSFPDSNDQPQSVSQWRGKILVINFWATWCGPCLKEIPEFIKLQQQYQDQGLQFVGIAIDDKESVQAYLKRIQINYPILIAGDAGSNLAHQLGNIINAVPFSVIVNQQGQIIHRQPGELSNEELLKIINPLFAAK